MSEVSINKKRSEVEALVTKMKDSASVVVVNYQGLTVEQSTTLRKNLREEDCELKVFKNNIARRAAEESGFPELNDSLVGPNAIAFSSKDSVSAVKVIYEFAKANPALELKVGVVDGEYLGNEDIQKIATIPSRDVLLTMLAMGMLTPLKELAIGLNMIAEGEGTTQENAEEAAEETKEENTEAEA